MSRPKRNFAPMPLAVLASDATPQEKLSVLAIMHHDWDGEKAWPSMARLAKLTGFKERTLREARAGLEARGWLKVEARQGRTNVYSLDVPDMSLDEFNAALDPGTRRRGTPAGGAAPPAPGATPLRTRTMNENQRNEADASPPPDAQLQKQALDPDPTPRRAAKADPRKEARGQLLAAFVRWWLNQPGHVGMKYPDHPGDKAAAERLLDGGVGAEDMPRLLAAWPGVADDYTKANAFAFRVFCGSFLKIQAAAAKAAPALRACTHPVDRYQVERSYGDGPDGYDAQEGKCLDCGRSVTRYQGGRVVG